MANSDINETISKIMGVELPFDQINGICLANSQEILREDAIYFDCIKSVFSIQYYFAMRYGSILRYGLTHEEKYYKLIWTAFLKSMLSLHSAITLTMNGMVGSARILMRHMFELLIIGKYASISSDVDFITKWENGENIQMQRDIYNKITYPEMSAIKKMWKLLCKYNHGTIYSQHIKFKSEEIIDDIFLNIVLISALLEMNNHFLNTHIMDTNLTYYLRCYAEDYNIFKVLKARIKDDLKIIKQFYKEDLKKTIYSYKLGWKLKESS